MISRALGSATAVLFLAAGCAHSVDDGSDSDASRGTIDKADLVGSCGEAPEASRCRGKAPTGNCYCDAGCERYGDCCTDYAAICTMMPSRPSSGTVAELGTDASRHLVTLATAADGLATPRDLAFHPTRSELWVINREIDGMAILFSPGTTRQRIEVRVDAFSNHFMEEPSSLAFGAGGNFGTCQESRNTYNDLAPANDFMGPTLWDSDLSIYARVNQRPDGDLGGSHIDMLHQSPLCMGIAHESANKYWVFDGLHGDIVNYDFRRDHGPGYDDHSDGVVHRYTEATVRRVADVPSHLVLDDASGLLYIADTGNSRIMRLDTRSGSADANLRPAGEPLAEYQRFTGATYELVTDTGLDQPSGIALHDGKLFVSDYATGEIVAFDLEGGELGRIDTGPAGIMGLAFNDAGKLHYVNGANNTVVRIDP